MLITGLWTSFFIISVCSLYMILYFIRTCLYRYAMYIVCTPSCSLLPSPLPSPSCKSLLFPRQFDLCFPIRDTCITLCININCIKHKWEKMCTICLFETNLSTNFQRKNKNKDTVFSVLKPGRFPHPLQMWCCLEVTFCWISQDKRGQWQGSTSRAGLQIWFKVATYKKWLTQVMITWDPEIHSRALVHVELPAPFPEDSSEP